LISNKGGHTNRHVLRAATMIVATYAVDVVVVWVWLTVFYKKVM